GRGEMEGQVRVRPELQAMITFRQLNLMLEPWPFSHAFDVIFCRNVVIYFSQETQERLFHRFAAALGPRGYLFLGHSESASTCSDVLEPVGRSVYRKAG
ncbi:MAG: chemotaxis protein CheR, partial [Pseudomonadales bacterium]|nr:chemotaxis protein CheR [Pseudomonadales bacterium]